MGYDGGDGPNHNKCCRQMSMDQRDTINLLMAPSVELAPRVPLTVTKRPRPLRANCTNPPVGLQGVLTGRPRKVPAIVVDFALFAYELDILEVRLYELAESVDHVMVVESAFSHKASRKGRHFQRQRHRFQSFASRIMYYDVDTCPEYKKPVDDHRNRSDRSKDGHGWDIQNPHRACIWSEALKRFKELPDDALVIFGDLDEVPNGEVIYHVKHCEINPGKVPMKLDLTLMAASLRALCFGVGERMVTIAEWRQVKEDGCIPKHRECPTAKQRKHGRVSNAGVHVSSFGSMVTVDYKGFNSAEGGTFPPLVVDGLGFCDADGPTLLQRQKLLQYSPRTVIRFWEKQTKPLMQRRPSRAELAACGVPWVLVENPDRYPFLYGESTYDLTQPESSVTPIQFRVLALSVCCVCVLCGCVLFRYAYRRATVLEAESVTESGQGPNFVND